MPVRRTYACDDCAYRWTVFHAQSSEAYPDCPQCKAGAHWVPGSFAITTHKAKAVDYAQKMAEETYGLSDMRDNLREGDTVVKAPPPVQGAEADALTQLMVEQAREATGQELSPQQAEAVKNFWQTGSMGGGASGAEVASAMGAPGAAAARSDGADPVELLHTGEKATRGVGPLAQTMNLEVVGKAKLEA